MLILGLLGMYFDAVVVFVMNSSLLFRLAVAILCKITRIIFRSNIVLILILIPILDQRKPRLLKQGAKTTHSLVEIFWLFFLLLLVFALKLS